MSSAFLFPGQGSQSLGMMSAFADVALVRETFAEASQALGYNLWALCQDGPAEELNRTEITQPAMLTADIATWRLWQDNQGSLPVVLAGHSLGEYAALVAAEAMAFSDAVQLVAERGRLMQRAVPAGAGAMAAILGLDDTVLEEVCAGSAGEQVVSCANYNAPGQVVIAGDSAAVERACEAARAAGARRALPLPVSVPSHCALMREAADGLAERLAEIEIFQPRIPVVHNVDVAEHSEAGAIREVLALQLWQPVRWTRSISRISGLGVDRFIECGPGKVLAGLNKRNAPEAVTLALTDPDALAAALQGN
jgi:[acyl-carrier-protein] S-malonyltransferase